MTANNLKTLRCLCSFVNINNFIFERFGSFEYKHSATHLLNRV